MDDPDSQGRDDAGAMGDPVSRIDSPSTSKLEKPAMILPRISIARAMIAIAIAALAFFVFRIDLGDWRVYRIWHEYIIGIVPMACVLSYGFVIGCSDVLRRGSCHPFLVG